MIETPPQEDLLPNEILPGCLWLGSKNVRWNSDFINTTTITHIVDASNLSSIPFFDGKVYLVQVNDNSLSQLPLRDVASYLHDALSSKDAKVLVHCNQGKSRAPSLVIAYLMIHHRMTLQEAFHKVKKRRPRIYPNSGFMQQLIELEKSLTGNEASVKFGYGGTLIWQLTKDEQAHRAKVNRNSDLYNQVLLMDLDDPMLETKIQEIDWELLGMKSSARQENKGEESEDLHSDIMSMDANDPQLKKKIHQVDWSAASSNSSKRGTRSSGVTMTGAVISNAELQDEESDAVATTTKSAELTTPNEMKEEVLGDTKQKNRKSVRRQKRRHLCCIFSALTCMSIGATIGASMSDPDYWT